MPRVPELLATHRLILRRYAPSDADQYYRLGLRNRVHLARYEADNPLRHLTSAEEAVALLASFGEWWDAGEAYFVGIFHKESMELIGQVYVGNVASDPLAFAVGYIVDQACQGHGYVTESVQRIVRWLFEDLGAHHVDIECDDTNTRSLAVAERCAFGQRTHLRSNMHHADGSVTGTLVYRLERTEWEMQ